MPGKIRFGLKLIAWLAMSFIAVIIVLFAIGCFWFAAPPYQGSITDHFDGSYFYNAPKAERRFAGFLKWMWTREPSVWRDWTDAPPGPPPPSRVGRGKLRITFINHATVLVQMDGLNILTDPVWSEKIGPLSWVGPRRHRPPGIEFEALPPIHVVLISHSHYDHLDMPTIERLVKKHKPKIYAGLGNEAFFKKYDIDKAHDMDWWDSVELEKGVTLTFVPSKHFSGRGLCDRNRTLWGGFVIEGSGGRVYFAADTGIGPHFTQIKEKLGPPKVSLLPIGAFLPRWFMAPVHLSPEEAVEAHSILGSSFSVPVHYGTFRLGDDGELTPIKRLRAALDARPELRDKFWILDFGEGRFVR